MAGEERRGRRKSKTRGELRSKGFKREGEQEGGRERAQWTAIVSLRTLVVNEGGGSKSCCRQ